MEQVIYERANGTRRVQVQTTGPTKTEQSHKDHVDIHKIMRKYKQTGMLPKVFGSPIYGDFSSGIEFHEANNRIIAAREEFMRLPSEIRKRFENDPGKIMDYLLDENNREELIRMGLIAKQPKIEVQDPEDQKKQPSQNPKAPEGPQEAT